MSKVSKVIRQKQVKNPPEDSLTVKSNRSHKRIEKSSCFGKKVDELQNVKHRLEVVQDPKYSLLPQHPNFVVE